MKYLLLTNAHGGINPKTQQYVTQGKRSPVWNKGEPKSMVNVYYEGVGSRDINKKMVEINRNPNLSIKILNETWIDTPISEKRSLIQNIINKLNISIDDVLCLETHSNATRDMLGKAKGCEFYTYIGQSKSDIFADYLGLRCREEFKDRPIRKDLSDGDLDKEAKFGILLVDKLYNIPIVLSENFFMDNEEECKKILMTDEGRKRIASYQLKATYDYFKI